MQGNVLFLFPDKRYVEALLDPARLPMKDIAKHPNIFSLTMYELGLIGERLNNYRASGFKIYHVVFPDYDDYLSEDTISNIITPKPGDMLLPVDITFDEMQESDEYPDFGELLGRLPRRPTVIGGFHYDDCVAKAYWEAKKQGLPCTIDKRITNYETKIYSLLCEAQLLGGHAVLMASGP